MANRFWVGGAGTWNATNTTNWSDTSGGTGGFSVPTTADLVYFDASSGTGAVSISAGNALNINASTFTGSWTGSGSLTVNGDFRLGTTMTSSFTGSVTITNSATIITSSKTIGQLIILAPSGTVTLGSALVLSSVLSVSQGSFDTGASYNITAVAINSLGSSTRSITLNGSTVTLSRSGTSSNAALFIDNMTNLTLSFNSCAINFSGATASIELPSVTSSISFNTVNFSNTTASGVVNIKGNHSFNTLTISAPTSDGTKTVNWAGQNQTISTLNANGNNYVRRIRFRSTVSSTPTQVTLNVTNYPTPSYIDFQDINAQGASASWSGTSLGNAGGNSNINFSAGKTVYWNLAGSNNFSATGWANSSGGAPAASNFPLPQDQAIIDNSSSGSGITFTVPYFLPTINTVNRTTAITVTLNSGVEIVGSIILSSAINFLGSSVSFINRGSTVTVQSAGKTFGQIFLSGNSTSTVVLGDALTVTNGIIQSSGGGCIFNASLYNVTAGSLSYNYGTLNLGSGGWTITGSGSSWSVGSSITLNKGTASILFSNNSTAGRLMYFGGKTYNSIIIGGSTATSTFSIGNEASTGPTFSDISSAKSVAHTIQFPVGQTTTTGTFNVAGSPGNLVTISTYGGAGHTLAKTGGGTISSDYLSITGSNATPANTWYAGSNSIDGGGNTGWIFPTSPSNFLMFFS